MGKENPIEASNFGETFKYLANLIAESGQTLMPNYGDQLLQSIVDAAGQIFGAAAASIALVDQEAQMIEFKVSYGHGDQDVVGQRIPLDTGIAGYVVMTGQPIALADVLQDPRFNQEFAESTGYVPKSILATPLEWQERVIGVMEVLDKIEAPRFDLRDMELLGHFAQQASIAIAQSQQYDLITETLIQTLSSWMEEDAPSELRPILKMILETDVQPERIQTLKQVVAVLHELLNCGEAERKMALEILLVIRDFLAERSTTFDLQVSGES
jgi:hypothetical protein